MGMTDLGLSHIALAVSDLERSIDFYGRFADMEVVHRRTGHDGVNVAWLSDLTRPFVIVLLENQQAAEAGEALLHFRSRCQRLAGPKPKRRHRSALPGIQNCRLRRALASKHSKRAYRSLFLGLICRGRIGSESQ